MSVGLLVPRLAGRRAGALFTLIKPHGNSHHGAVVLFWFWPHCLVVLWAGLNIWLLVTGRVGLRAHALLALKEI